MSATAQSFCVNIKQFLKMPGAYTFFGRALSLQRPIEEKWVFTLVESDHLIIFD